MAVATGFQGRTVDVQEPRTGVPRIDLPGAAADAVFADAKAFLSSSEARQMSESELERELHRRGQQLVRKLLQEHHDQRSPGETAGPAEDASGVECSEPCVHESHTETTSGTMQVVRPGCARRHGLHPLDAALNLLPERYLFEMRRVSIATASRAPPRTPWKPQWYSTSSTSSVDGSKPAIYGHLKTGHFRRPETGVEYYFTASSVGKVESLPMTHEPEGGVVSNDT